MKIGNALKDLKKPCISFEFFPPSDDSELPAFYDVAEKLAGASPLFASVTYGAGGSKQGRTLSVAKALAGMGLTVMSHLTCVGASPLRLMNYMYDLREAGVNNILALGRSAEGQAVFVGRSFPPRFRSCVLYSQAAA